ncbi:phosphate/phosphite/phosphonate ABC transporter substrate-binding protein [Nitratireductor aquimarinus]|nr:phosphate/phosphite/phosphonate ABC transporter substrate-binding protein [Nitratireductor pacificus]MBN7782823.1 phosphate/phosphite/phosphonate ABC transporter substrate-binding protein [Nitratireductor pacificus]MBN7791630.1 phosphate/phosphite/phosphonate ABC transporter substrate-binding protein [Nitratireductor aquimarinus]MBY6100888.1 phosphate/phosphite/phosphonate ABC transporter substrate-binding protein [Nitratireductor aquimarinus]
MTDCSRPTGLDVSYRDANGDLVADLPDDASKWRDPPTLVWAYAPIEDPAVYAELFKPFTQHLAACLGRQIVYYPVESSSAEVDAMRSGRLHFAGFSTGSTVAAVNQAGAVPFAAKAVGSEMRSYRLVALVRAGSPYKSIADLVGKRVAHATPISNSGNYAPRALFPQEGLVPDVDYIPIMTGGHDRSILGLLSGDYDMAAVASDVLERMQERGLVSPDDVREIYKSQPFPTSSFAHAHDLDPVLARTLQACFYNFEFPPRLQEEFNGDTNFAPINYQKDWATVRAVREQVGAEME